MPIIIFPVKNGNKYKIPVCSIYSVWLIRRIIKSIEITLNNATIWDKYITNKTQLTLTCSNSKKEPLEKRLKYVQS